MRIGHGARATCLAALLALLAASLLASGCADLKRLAYEGLGRDRWQQPEKVIDSLALRAGNAIADLGSGGGYFTFRLADAVGAEGTVYAVDVDADMTEYVEERAREAGYGNVRSVLAEYADPLIPEPRVDLIFTCNTYHHLEERAGYFRNAQKYLRPGGRVAIIEYSQGSWLNRSHYTAAEVIKREMAEAGYRLEREFDFLERQSFLVFAAESG